MSLRQRDGNPLVWGCWVPHQCFDEDGYDVDGYDEDGYSLDGYDRDGYERDGVHRDDEPIS
jgi:hypothetical protein